MNMRVGPIVKGSLTYIPGLKDVLLKKDTGGTNSARYCYDVWLKHLTMLGANGMESIPNTLAELGPGDSIGIGQGTRGWIRTDNPAKKKIYHPRKTRGQAIG